MIKRVLGDFTEQVELIALQLLYHQSAPCGQFYDDLTELGLQINRLNFCVTKII